MPMPNNNDNAINLAVTPNSPNPEQFSRASTQESNGMATSVPAASPSAQSITVDTNFEIERQIRAASMSPHISFADQEPLSYPSSNTSGDTTLSPAHNFLSNSESECSSNAPHPMADLKASFAKGRQRGASNASVRSANSDGSELPVPPDTSSPPNSNIKSNPIIAKPAKSNRSHRKSTGLRRHRYSTKGRDPLIVSNSTRSGRSKTEIRRPKMMRYAQSDVYGKRRNPERRGTAFPQLSTKTDISNSAASAVVSDPEDSVPIQPNFRKEESLSHWRDDSEFDDDHEHAPLLKFINRNELMSDLKMQIKDLDGVGTYHKWRKNWDWERNRFRMLLWDLINPKQSASAMTKIDNQTGNIMMWLLKCVDPQTSLAEKDQLMKLVFVFFPESKRATRFVMDAFIEKFDAAGMESSVRPDIIYRLSYWVSEFRESHFYLAEDRIKLIQFLADNKDFTNNLEPEESYNYERALELLHEINDDIFGEFREHAVSVEQAEENSDSEEEDKQRIMVKQDFSSPARFRTNTLTVDHDSMNRKKGRLARIQQERMRAQKRAYFLEMCFRDAFCLLRLSDFVQGKKRTVWARRSLHAEDKIDIWKYEGDDEMPTDDMAPMGSLTLQAGPWGRDALIMDADNRISRKCNLFVGCHLQKVDDEAVMGMKFESIKKNIEQSYTVRTQRERSKSRRDAHPHKMIKLTFQQNNTLNLTRLQHWVTESVKIWITEDVLRLDEEIPENEDVKRAIRIRADRLSEWINIADLLKDEYCNFQAASAIISVLDHFLFQRLKRTWKMLSKYHPRKAGTFEELKHEFAHVSNPRSRTARRAAKKQEEMAIDNCGVAAVTPIRIRIFDFLQEDKQNRNDLQQPNMKDRYAPAIEELDHFMELRAAADIPRGNPNMGGAPVSTATTSYAVPRTKSSYDNKVMSKIGSDKPSIAKRRPNYNSELFNDEDYHYVWGRLEHPNDSWKKVKQALKAAAQLEKEIDDKEGVRCFGFLKAIKFMLPTFVVLLVSFFLLCETLMNLFLLYLFGTAMDDHPSFFTLFLLGLLSYIAGSLVTVWWTDYTSPSNQELYELIDPEESKYSKTFKGKIINTIFAIILLPIPPAAYRSITRFKDSHNFNLMVTEYNAHLKYELCRLATVQIWTQSIPLLCVKFYAYSETYQDDRESEELLRSILFYSLPIPIINVIFRFSQIIDVHKAWMFRYTQHENRLWFCFFFILSTDFGIRFGDIAKIFIYNKDIRIEYIFAVIGYTLLYIGVENYATRSKSSKLLTDFCDLSLYIKMGKRSLLVFSMFPHFDVRHPIFWLYEHLGRITSVYILNMVRMAIDSPDRNDESVQMQYDYIISLCYVINIVCVFYYCRTVYFTGISGQYFHNVFDFLCKRRKSHRQGTAHVRSSLMSNSTHLEMSQTSYDVTLRDEIPLSV